MHILSEQQPIVAQQAGVWEGEYVHLDASHKIIDRHQSQLVCRLQDGPDGEAKLSQTNIYNWPDGTREIRYFEGVFKADRVWISNDLIDDWTGAVAMDPTNRTIMVGWTRPREPDFRYYEMITVAEDGNAKNRTWHWYRKGRLFQRTLINEVRISREWQAYDDPVYYRFHARGSTSAQGGGQ
ncbi:DUF3598 domain-containing protein [Blastomonas fulva]|uniref:DUF3598 domain-containing protein n=1 Tax=Blastomonas fulva TaxID=1550728 RepID=UPI003F7150E6